MIQLSASPVLRLTQIIGSPFCSTAKTLDGDIESQELHQLASKNKILLLYLETLERRGKLSHFRTKYQEEQARYLQMLDVVTRVSQSLSNVEHAVIKTVRPYPAVPADVDVIALGDDRAYKAAVISLLRGKFDPLQPGLIDRKTLTSPESFSRAADKLIRPTYGRLHVSPGGTHFVDATTGFHVDLQRELSISHLVYMDKTKFGGCLTSRKLDNGSEIGALSPSLEMAVVIAHSISHREYRLGEFYTLLYNVREMDENDVQSLCDCLDRNCLRQSASAFVSLTTQLYQAAFGEVPSKLRLLNSKVGVNTSEKRRISHSSYTVPHCYGRRTLWRVFLEKARERKFRRSVLIQAAKMFDPRMMCLVVRELRGKQG